MLKGRPRIWPSIFAIGVSAGMRPALAHFAEVRMWETDTSIAAYRP
ncbi:MAG TPA: hypothetical protein VKG25_04295 [Bryobacteraceae bacterium]|nr:hypothetical protein [Bryobacteraceae bacterium]